MIEFKILNYLFLKDFRDSLEQIKKDIAYLQTDIVFLRDDFNLMKEMGMLEPAKKHMELKVYLQQDVNNLNRECLNQKMRIDTLEERLATILKKEKSNG